MSFVLFVTVFGLYALEKLTVAGASTQLDEGRGVSSLAIYERNHPHTTVSFSECTQLQCNSSQIKIVQTDLRDEQTTFENLPFPLQAPELVAEFAP